jgi:hypothetical protein
MLEHKARFALDSCPIDSWRESDTDWMNGKYDEVLELLQPRNESKGPVFPRNPELNDTYTWNDNTWTWNGSLWAINQ